MAGRTDDGNGAANAIADSNMTLKLLRDKRFITTSEITYLDAGRIATVTRLLMIVAEAASETGVAKVLGTLGSSAAHDVKMAKLRRAHGARSYASASGKERKARGNRREAVFGEGPCKNQGATEVGTPLIPNLKSRKT